MTGFLASEWAVAAFAFVAGSLGVLALVLVGERVVARRRRREIVERIGPATDNAAAETVASELLRSSAREEEGLAAIVGQLPHVADLRMLLDQSGAGWSPIRFLLFTAGSALIFGIAGYLFVGSPIVAVAPAIFGMTIPYMILKRKKKKRLQSFEESFPEAIDLLGRAIRAGHAFSIGLQMVADEMPDPLSSEFRQVFEEQKFGLALDDSLLAMADRIDLVDVKIFVTAVLIQREVGGNLAEILDKIAATIRERFTIQRQVRVYTAQGRFTGYLLAVLPFALGFLIFLLNSEYMSILWEAPLGRVLMMVALLLQITGFFVIRRIVDIEV